MGSLTHSNMKKYILLLLLNIEVFVQCAYEFARYDNYLLYDLIIETDNQIDVVNAIESYSDSYTVLENSLNSAKVIVPPHKYGEFWNLLQEHAFRFDILSEDLQSDIDVEKTRMRTVTGEFKWDQYHRLADIYGWMENLAATYPENITQITVGKTYEGREINGVKLSFKPDNPGIILEGGMHAREWIAPAVVTYILNELINSKNEDVRSIAESYDWYVIPVANPDGYEYSHTSDRFWRKTRKPYLFICYGADPNRNWDFHWGEHGTSPFPCAETYRGDKPFSEIETLSMARYLKTLQGKIKAYIAFHSYSQLLLFPYGYTKEHAPNHNDLQEIGNEAVKSLAKRYGTLYKVGNIYETIYPASGSSMEWAYEILDAKIAYTYELRPNSNSGANGFILPANQIIPTGKETLDSLVTIFREAKNLGYP